MAMDCSEMAIEAMEKGEKDFPTLHTIQLTEQSYTISKKSRVNDLTESYRLHTDTVTNIIISKDGKSKNKVTSVSIPKLSILSPTVETDVDGNPIPVNPDNLVKQMKENTAIKVITKMPTSNGTALVTDQRELSSCGRYLVQVLTVENVEKVASGASGGLCSTTRYFRGYDVPVQAPQQMATS